MLSTAARKNFFVIGCQAIGVKAGTQEKSLLFTLDVYKLTEKDSKIQFVCRSQFSNSVFGHISKIDTLEMTAFDSLVMISGCLAALFKFVEGESIKLLSYSIIPDDVQAARFDGELNAVTGLRGDSVVVLDWESGLFDLQNFDHSNELELSLSVNRFGKGKSIYQEEHSASLQKDKDFLNYSSVFDTWFNDKESRSVEKKGPREIPKVTQSDVLTNRRYTFAGNPY